MEEVGRRAQAGGWAGHTLTGPWLGDLEDGLSLTFPPVHTGRLRDVCPRLLGEAKVIIVHVEMADML